MFVIMLTPDATSTPDVANLSAVVLNAVEQYLRDGTGSPSSPRPTPSAAKKVNCHLDATARLDLPGADREKVAFRIDFPNWLATLTARERLLVHAMARNERTLDLSRHFDLSPGRISQLRRELHSDWHRFLGDVEEPCSV